jgi:2-polyprenyl-6-methoxyphenol hydroxylase-like FAD-dependent oxidoreductase
VAKPLKVIVSGAGVAGLALAYWLDRIGASSIVIERQPSFQRSATPSR